MPPRRTVLRTIPAQPYPALAFLLTVFSGWVNRHQQRVTEFLVEENRILRRKFGKRRIRFTGTERRRLAQLGRVLGRKLLSRVAAMIDSAVFYGTTTAPPDPAVYAFLRSS